MNHILGPEMNSKFCMALAVLLGAGIVALPHALPAQAGDIGQIVEGPGPLLLGHGAGSSQGYLGVDLSDVDQEKAQALKLKEVRGAVITLIDHDAPAGQIGLRVNDVVLKLNGQSVEGAEQLRRMLREIPAGHKVSIEISRDGNIQTVAAQLVDRRKMEQDVWKSFGSGTDVFIDQPASGFLAGGDTGGMGGGHLWPFGSTLNVGVLVEPLTSQMAEYLGVPNGLMVKTVARKSEAEAAGLKAFDIILRVGAEGVSNLAGWDRALRANQGKAVPVTILRDKKQQTLTLQVDSKRHGELRIEELFPAGDCPQVAGIDPQFAVDAEAIADRLRAQMGSMHVEIDPRQAEEMRRAAQELKNSLINGDFKLDQKQMDELKQQMEQFRKEFKPEDFKIDPKQMNDLKQQMEQFKRQMEDWKPMGFGNHA